MALLAGLRESSLNVIRVRRALVALQMARHAGCHRDVVVVVDVAIDALSRRNGVCSCKREPRRGVVKFCTRPRCGVVALLARLSKTSLHVVRVRGRLEIFQVTRDAGSDRDVVVVIGMAIGTLPRRHGMRSSQWEAGLGMIERSRLPRRSRMTLFTSLRKSTLHVVGVDRGLKIFEVA